VGFCLDQPHQIFLVELSTDHLRRCQFFMAHWLSHFMLSFYPRDAMLARVIGIATCLSVRPSVYPSVRPSRAGIVSKRIKLAA